MTRQEEIWELYEQGEKGKAIAEKLGISYGSVRGSISKERTKRLRQHITQLIDEITLPQLPPSLQEQQKIIRGCVKQWETHQEKLASLKRLSRFAFLGDIHLPYQSNPAIELAALLLESHKPDVVTGFNDVFDFSKMGTWEDDTAVFERVWHGDLQNAINAHNHLMQIFKSASPLAAHVAIIDNHGSRLFKYVRRKAEWVADYTATHFLRDITNQGLLWLDGYGAKVDQLSVELSPTFSILHGYRVGKKPTDVIHNTLMDYRFRRSLIFGHIHRMGLVHMAAPDYDIMGASSGCLCQLQPFWSQRYMGWEQGIVLGYYDLSSPYVSFELVKFNEYRGKLLARFQGQEYTVKI